MSTSAIREAEAALQMSGLRLWFARAMSSFLVPVSPQISAGSDMPVSQGRILPRGEEDQGRPRGSSLSDGRGSGGLTFAGELCPSTRHPQRKGVTGDPVTPFVNWWS